MLASVNVVGVAAVALLAWSNPCSAELVSDITHSPVAQRDTLLAEGGAYWKSLAAAVDASSLIETQHLLQDAAAVLDSLPAKNSAVHAMMSEAVASLHEASNQVFTNAVEGEGLVATEVAREVEKVMRQAPSNGLGMPLPASVLAVVHRASGGKADDEGGFLARVGDRQQRTLPLLKSAASVTGSVLTNCRMATRRSFDALKFDIYTKGSPKTPEELKDVANRVIDASGRIRKHFTQMIVGMANALSDDVLRHQQATAASQQGDSPAAPPVVPEASPVVPAVGRQQRGAVASVGGVSI